jgi:hypothetical protein
MTREAKIMVRDAANDERIEPLGIEHAFAIFAREIQYMRDWTNYKTGQVEQKNAFNYELLRAIQTVANIANEAVNTDAVWPARNEGERPQPKGLNDRVDQNQRSARALLASFDAKDIEQVKRLKQLNEERTVLSEQVLLMENLEDIAAEAVEYHTGSTYTRYNGWLNRKSQDRRDPTESLDVEALLAEALSVYGKPANTQPKKKAA